MTSSDAVFARESPFPPAAPLPMAWYHPSRGAPRSVSDMGSETTADSQSKLSSRVRRRPKVPPGKRRLGDPALPSDNDPGFPESWPSTELISSPAEAAASSTAEMPTQPPTAGGSTGSSPERRQPLLAKYVERFRYGQPTTRAERQPITSALGEERPASRLRPPSHKGIHSPANPRPVEQRRRPSTPNMCGESLNISALSSPEISDGDLDDTEILELQQRASRLQQKSESSISSGSIPISAEGLGRSNSSSPISIDEPVRRPLLSSLLRYTTAVNPSSASSNIDPSQKPITRSSSGHTRQAEDILFQWRLRRKIDDARLGVQPQSQQHLSLPLHPATVTGCLDQRVSKQWQQQQHTVQPPDPPQRMMQVFIPLPQPGEKELYQLCLPAVAPSTPAHLPHSSRTDAELQAHWCPTQSSPPTMQHKSLQTMLDGSKTIAAPKKAHPVLKESPGSKKNEAPSKQQSPLLTSSGTIEEEWAPVRRRTERKDKQQVQTNESGNEKDEKRTATSNRKQKKKTRSHDGEGDHTDVHSHRNRAPKNVASGRAKLRSEDGSLESQRPGSSQRGSGAPPASPIHTALGKVVSEVLFPTPDSSSALRADSSECTLPARPPSPVPPVSVKTPREVISQLLRDAEDSDEKEFENDPLLQVLRKQRKWVKEQIREVDSMLD